jgi:hypothetical protein
VKSDFIAVKDSFFPFIKKTADCVSPKEMDLMDHLEKIVELSKRHGIDKCQKKGKIHLDHITQKLGINNVQAVLFSNFMDQSDDNRIMVSDIARSIKCGTIKILKYLNECEKLEKKRLIRCSSNNGSISFRVSHDVRDSLRKYNEIRLERRENLSIGRFFSVLKKLFNEREHNELSS